MVRTVRISPTPSHPALVQATRRRCAIMGPKGWHRGCTASNERQHERALPGSGSPAYTNGDHNVCQASFLRASEPRRGRSGCGCDGLDDGPRTLARARGWRVQRRLRARLVFLRWLLARPNYQSLPHSCSAAAFRGRHRSGGRARTSLGGALPSHYQTGSIRRRTIPLRRARMRVRQRRVIERMRNAL
jgi:hypothetical protein